MRINPGITRVASSLSIAAALLLGAAPLSAQDYPTKPIRVVTPTTAGSTADVVSRIVANELSKVLGRPVVVEPKPGANNLIGLDYIARQPADGYTVGIVGLDGVALAPLMSKDLRFDPLKDLTAVRGLVEASYVLAVPAVRPWKTLEELVAYAKANPGKLNYGSSAFQVRFPALLLMQEHGLDIVHIPFSAGRTYTAAIVGGTLDLGFVTERAVMEVGNRLRVLGVTGPQRLTTYPAVPTFTELKLPQIKGPSYAMIIRTGTSKPVFDKLASSASSALGSAEGKSSMDKIGLRITDESAEMVRKNLLALTQSYGSLAKQVDLSSDK